MVFPDGLGEKSIKKNDENYNSTNQKSLKNSKKWQKK